MERIIDKYLFCSSEKIFIIILQDDKSLFFAVFGIVPICKKILGTSYTTGLIFILYKILNFFPIRCLMWMKTLVASKTASYGYGVIGTDIPQWLLKIFNFPLLYHYGISIISICDIFVVFICKIILLFLYSLS